MRGFVQVSPVQSTLHSEGRSTECGDSCDLPQLGDSDVI
jgi:hypothetical protein